MSAAITISVGELRTGATESGLSTASDAQTLYALLQRHGICQLAVALEASGNATLQSLFQESIKVVLGEQLAEPWSYLRSRDSRTLRGLTEKLSVELRRRASNA